MCSGTRNTVLEVHTKPTKSETLGNKDQSLFIKKPQDNAVVDSCFSELTLKIRPYFTY